MIPIEKGSVPRELSLRLSELKGTPGVTDYYALLADAREPVLRSLIAEQGYLCAYCMRRISYRGEDGGSEGTIEHIVPQHDQSGVHHHEESVDYRNMLAVCDGHAGCKETTCDKHRGNTQLKKVNPLRPHTLVDIRYRHDGSIHSLDIDVNYDLTVTLNLNARGTSLCESRKAVIDEINRKLEREFNKISSPENIASKKRICEKMLKLLESSAPKKFEYLGVARYILEKRIKRYSR